MSGKKEKDLELNKCSQTSKKGKKQFLHETVMIKNRFILIISS